MGQIPILSCEHVSFCYPRQTEDAIHDISLKIEETEFVVLCGRSGCGKTTLLRHFKKNQIPFGSGSGQLYYRGRDLEKMDDRESAARIGYVGQNPETQLVTDKVWHELAFGLENLGIPGSQIRRRTAEIAQYFGMESWFHKPVTELSGGQKQILNLAAVVIMQPDVLLLDEPTAQLDPIGTRRFLDTLGRLNRDLGTAVLLSEQRLEEVIPMADRVLIMEEGRLIGDTVPEKCGSLIEEYEKKHGRRLSVAPAMPAAVKVWQKCHDKGELTSPVSIREGRAWLQTKVRNMGQTDAAVKNGTANNITANNVTGSASELTGIVAEKRKQRQETGEIVLQADRVSFEYERGKRVLEDFSLQVPGGKIYAVMGGNGSGKSTALKVLMGIYKPRRGKVKTKGTLRYLAQNPRSLFTELTVEEELLVMQGGQMHREGTGQAVKEMLQYLELTELGAQNPMDLSGGQQQRLAMGKLLMTDPDILLLDEPTKGMDGAFKSKLAQLLRDLCTKGKTVVLVSHDMDFCAQYADICGFLFDGQMISQDDAETFFGDNVFYTTPASRMAQGIIEGCFRPEDITAALQKAGDGS